MSSHSGPGLEGQKVFMLHLLRLSCREGVETRYIVRTLVQNLRVNANWRSIIGPLARAVIMHRSAPELAECFASCS